MLICIIDDKRRLIGTKEPFPMTKSSSNEFYIDSDCPEELFTDQGSPIYGINLCGNIVKAEELDIDY